jgi:signal transduction histidine kinase
MARALVVEDSHTQALALSAILEVSNFEVVRASRLSEALERRDGGLDIILLDLTLPDSAGLDTVIHMHQAVPSVPIVVLTSTDDEALAVKALHEGAQDYLVKGQMDANLLVRSMRYAIERKRAEEQVRTLNAKLAERVQELEETQEKLIHAERLKALGMIAAGFAHELNNPMMGIINQIQYALAKLPADSRTAEVLNEALGHTRRCVRIVNDLLTYSRKEGAPRGEQASGNMNGALRASLNATQEALRAAGVTVTLHLDDEAPFVALDENHLQQVFVNLIMNARDAMATAPRKHLTLTTRASGEEVTLTARDTGSGMDAYTLSRIFEPFYTTKPPGAGTGLGLSLCRNLVESVGGRIDVESAPARGSTFTVTVPVAKDARGGRKTMKKVLVIDDDAAVRSAFQLALEDTGFEVVVAGGGEEGLARLDEDRFDLVYLDLKMPGIDGIETLRRLRKRGHTLPVRIVTAFAEEFMRPLEAAVGEGLEFEVVRKPLGREGIRTVTMSILGEG